MKQKKLLVSLFFLLFCGTFVCTTKSQAKILTIKHSTKNVYTTKYQREATSYLTKWKKGKRTLDDPLLVKNPYGTKIRIFPNKLVNTAKSPSVSRYSTKRLISLKSTRLQRYSSPIPLRPYQSEKIRKYNKKKI